MEKPMLYIFDDFEEMDDGFPERSIPLQSAQRRKKAFSYRFIKDRKLSVTAYLLLRLALKENFGIEETVAFLYGDNGKPALCDYPNIHFNLSHCRNAAVCALSFSEIGVDVEEIAPAPDNLAKRILTAKEFAVFKSAEDPDRQFCEYWTAKESRLKLTGQGIGAEPAEETGDITLFVSDKNYCCCVTGASVQVRCVSVHELEAF